MKEVLVVVDMQVDFVSGSLGTKEAQEMIEDCAQFIKNYPHSILVTMDTHQENYLSSNEGKHLPVVHCVKGSPGWNLDPRIQEALHFKEYEVIEKGQFGSLELVKKLEDLAPEKISLIGICTDICVISNALILKAAFPEIEIEVLASFTSATSPKMKDESLELMKINQITIKEKQS